jgi:hypothetical protein
VVDNVALGQVFSEYFGFLFQFSFHRLLHIHHLPSEARTISQAVADVPSGLSLTPPQELIKKRNKEEVQQRTNDSGGYCLHSECHEILNITAYDHTFLQKFQSTLHGEASKNNRLILQRLAYFPPIIVAARSKGEGTPRNW